MNRSIVGLGAGIFLLALGLIASPIALLGHEAFTLEQEIGLYVIAPALAVILIGAIADDPRVTTVGGAFGNPDVALERLGRARPPGPPLRPLTYHPNEAVACRYCASIIQPDLAQCPRCGRARDCRTCGRPLGIVLERATCPACAQPEPFCRCPRLPPRAGPNPSAGRRV